MKVVQNENGPGICGECLAHAVIALYDNGDRLPTLEKGLRDLFVISSEQEMSIRTEVLEELRAQYQREFLELREPVGAGPNENERANITLAVNRYTFDRVRALAQEANMPVSHWLRQAIFLAFKATSHRT
jgi:hypothetical protein